MANELPEGNGTGMEPERNNSPVRTGIIVIAVIVALSACLWFVRTHGGLESGDAWTKEFSDAVWQAEIDVVSGDVVLYPAEGRTVRVEYSGSRACVCSAELKNGTLTVKEEQKRFGVFSWRLWELWRPYPQVIVYLPSGCTLTMDSVSGDIRIAPGVEANDTVIGSVSGDLNAEALHCGALTFSTVSGDAKLTHTVAAGNAVFDTVSGDVHLNDFEAVITSFDTISGDISAYNADAVSWEIDTTSGDVRLSLREPRNYVIDTMSGDVQVPTSVTGAGTCRVDTVSGDIRITDGR